MNKRHWNTVTVDGELPDRLVRELIEDSYDLVVAGLPKAERLRLDRAGGQRPSPVATSAAAARTITALPGEDRVDTGQQVARRRRQDTQQRDADREADLLGGGHQACGQSLLLVGTARGPPSGRTR